MMTVQNSVAWEMPTPGLIMRILLMKVYMRMQPTLDALKSEAGGGDMFLVRKQTSFFISALIYDDSAVLLYV